MAEVLMDGGVATTLGWGARVLVVAEATVLLAAMFDGSLADHGVITALLLLPSAVAVAGCAFVRTLLADGPVSDFVSRARLAVVASVPVAFACVEGARRLSVISVVDTRSAPVLLAVACVALVAAVAVFVVLRKAQRVVAHAAHGWFGALLALGAAMLVSALDAYVVPVGLPALHAGAMVVVLGLLGWVVTASPAAVMIIPGIGAVLAVLVTYPWAKVQSSYEYVGGRQEVSSSQVTEGSSTAMRGATARLVIAPGLARRVITIARELLDGDGDGFSRVLGGNDCDDSDATIFPFSAEGRGCFGLTPQALPARHAPLPPGEDAETPQVIVLATIDAFRCDFGLGEEREERDHPALRDVCPRLRALGEEGALRTDAHTSYPATRFAMADLNMMQVSDIAEGLASSDMLAGRLTSLGFETVAFSAHPYQVSRRVEASFGRVDRSFERFSREPLASSSDEITDAGLSAIRAHMARPGATRLFVWVHYLDPHDPYVEEAGARWSTTSRLARYATEVRRVDAAIGRLADGLRDVASSVLFVTADHGEEFGERGVHHHGLSLAETGLRVPMIAWSPRRDLVATRPLPASTTDVGPYLLGLASGTWFLPPEDAFFRARIEGRLAYGIVDGNGLKITFDEGLDLMRVVNIQGDPYEREDGTGREFARDPVSLGKLWTYRQSLTPARTSASRR